MDVDSSHDSTTAGMGMEIPMVEHIHNADENIPIQKK